MSSIDELRRSARPKVHKFTVGETTVHLRALSGAGRSKYMSCTKGNDTPLAQIAALSVCEEDGTLSFDVDRDKDIDALNEFDGAILQAIALKTFEISGMGAKAVEEAEKKS